MRPSAPGKAVFSLSTSIAWAWTQQLISLKGLKKSNLLKQLTLNQFRQLKANKICKICLWAGYRDELKLSLSTCWDHSDHIPTALPAICLCTHTPFMITYRRSSGASCNQSYFLDDKKLVLLTHDQQKTWKCLGFLFNQQLWTFLYSLLIGFPFSVI